MRPPDNLRIHLAGDVVGDFGQPLISPHLPLDVVLRCPLPTSLLALMGSPGDWHWRPWSVSSFPLSRSLCTWASAKETQKSYGRFGGEHNQQLVPSPQKHLNDPLAALAVLAVATVPKMGLKYSHEVN